MTGRIMLALALAAASIGTAGAQTATAARPTALYVFGDSLSDRGNLADAVGHHFPTPPFYHDSFTNGDTAVQVLAQRLGLNADASLFPTGFRDVSGLGYTSGTNYAVAGATAGTAIPTGLSPTQGVTGLNLGTQVGAFLTQGGSTDGLATVFIGGNDVRTAAHQGFTDASGTFTYNSAYITDGVTSELAVVNLLVSRGFKNVLVVNVPDIGVIPEFTTYSPAGQAAAATAATVAYNGQLASGIGSIQAANQSANVRLFDLYSYNSMVNLASLGITNTTQPCYVSYGGVTNASPLVINPACGPIDPSTGQAANIGQFAYWDPIHPTAKVQFAIGNALADFVAGSVPEPSTWLTMIVGFGLVGSTLRRRSRTVVRVRYAA